jgi:hypothetical protein
MDFLFISPRGAEPNISVNYSLLSHKGVKRGGSGLRSLMREAAVDE